MKRLQTRDLNQKVLQPEARPVDTFVAPGGVDPSQGLRQLADALENVQPTLHAYGSKRMEQHKEEMNYLAEGRLGGMTIDQALAERKAGTLAESDDVWYQKALEFAFAKKLTRYREDDLIRRLSGESTAGEGMPSNAIDPLRMNVDEVLADQITSDFDEYGIDPSSPSGGAYTRQMEATRTRLLDFQAKAKSDEAKRQAYDASFSAFSEVIANGEAQGFTPQQIHSGIQQQIRENEALFRLNKEEQNEHILRLADQLASQGKYQLVNEILYGDRVQANGQNIPGLGTSGRYADTASKILSKAASQAAANQSEAQFNAHVNFNSLAVNGELNEKELAEWRKQNPHIISDAQAQRYIVANRNAREKAHQLRMQIEINTQAQFTANEINSERDSELIASMESGQLPLYDAFNYAEVDKKTGELKLKPMDAEKIKDYGRDLYLEKYSPTIAQKRQETPQQTLIRETEVLSKNGIEHPRVKRVLNAGVIALGAVAASGTGEIPPAFSQGLVMYQTLRSTNPAYLNKHIKPTDAELYELTIAGKDLLGLSDEQAALSAYRVMNGEGAVNKDIAKQEVANAIGKIIEVDRTFWFDSPVNNPGIVSARITNLATQFRRLGLSPEDAVKQARDKIKGDYIEVNGWAVPTGGTVIPSHFEETVKERIAEIAKRLDLDEEDLTVSPIGQAPNTWSIVYGASGLPVDPSDRSVFTTQGLFRQKQEDEKKRLEQAKQDNVANLNKGVGKRQAINKQFEEEGRIAP